MDRRLEHKSKSVVFAFGRINPPTAGHSKLMQKVASEATKRGADHVVYLSQTQKSPSDPLEWNYKRQISRMAFPGINISSDSSMRTPFEALEELGKSYNSVTMVVRDDRADHFRSQMSKYTKEWGIDNFDVISSGTRDSDSGGVDGISASKARAFAENGDFDGFSSMMPPRLTDNIKHDIYHKIRSSMGLEEDADNKNADEYRAKGLRGEFAYSGWG